MTRMSKTRRARLRLALATTVAGALALAATMGAREARAEGPADAAGSSRSVAAASPAAAPSPAPAERSAPAVRSAPAAPPASSGPTATQGALREARGEFDVKVAPLAKEAAEGITLGRMSLEKTFRGALVAASTGEMLTVDTAGKPSSGAYAATERVTGVLDGRRGSFALVHVGTMASGSYRLQISIVPDSGTEELEGIEGTLAIDIRDGKHYYVLAYALPGK